MVCSALHRIETDPFTACELLGLDVNPKTEIDEDFAAKIARGLPVSDAEVRANAVCHNMTWSYDLYGKSPIKLNSSRETMSALTKEVVYWLINVAVILLVV